METSTEKQAKITKTKFIQAVVYQGFSESNKSVAVELNISESYFYKLLKKYGTEISKELHIKKNSLRLKSISVLEYHLAQKNLQAAIAILKQIEYTEPPEELNEGNINIHFKMLAEVIAASDTRQEGKK